MIIKWNEIKIIQPVVIGKHQIVLKEIGNNNNTLVVKIFSNDSLHEDNLVSQESFHLFETGVFHIDSDGQIHKNNMIKL